MLPVLTYYQLQPSARFPMAQEARAGYVLRNCRAIRDYWVDVENTLKITAEISDPRIVLQFESDGWEFIEQLAGVQTSGSAATSAAGVDQTTVSSVADSRSIGAIRAGFYAQLHVHFDLAVTDAPGTPYTSATFRQRMAMISDFHCPTHLHVLLWQIPTFLLGRSRAASRRQRRARHGGVTGILGDPGTTGGSRLLRIVHNYERRERAR